MNAWLKNYFQSDEVPSKEILQRTYDSACRTVQSGDDVFGTLKLMNRLIEEMEADAEICNIIE